MSTGPRTPEGLERSRKSGWKHGHYSAEAKRVRRKARQQYRLLRQLIAAGTRGRRSRPHQLNVRLLG